jgi:4a-hydroxytetrahydrobiopterin dehydratase
MFTRADRTRTERRRAEEFPTPTSGGERSLPAAANAIETRSHATDLVMSPRPRMSSGDVDSFVKAHSGWKLEQAELRKTYEFPSFMEAIRFVNEIAELAEKEDHHPDIDIRYKRVKIALVTYDSDGITKKDTELAAGIDDLFAKRKKQK